MFNFQTLSTLSILLYSMSVLSYQPPLGIPDPGIAWNGGDHPVVATAPERPSNWNAVVSGFYYVDPSSSNATDSNNAYGHPQQPRMTIPYTVPSGSYVELHGHFPEEQKRISYKCTIDAPCWIRGQESTNMPTMPGRLRLENSYHVFVEHLNFDGGTAGAFSITGDSHNIVFRHSRITNRAQPNGASSGVSIIPDRGKTVEKIVVYNNHIESLGDWTITEDLDFHGIVPSLWGRDSSSELKNVWILNNYCTHLSGDCVQVNAGNWTDSHKYLHHIYIGQNESFQNRQSGFWIKQASDVIISQNKSHGSDGNGGANAGSAAGMQYPKDNVWFIFNELYDSVYGIRQSDTGQADDIYIIGNLIYNIRPAANNSSYDPTNAWEQGAAIALWHGSSNRFIIDNTIHGVYDGINAIYNGKIELFGNIISQKDDHPSNTFFTMTHPTRNDNVEMDYNLFIDDNTESYYVWWKNRGAVNSLLDIQSLSNGRCSNCLSIKGDSSELFINNSTNPAFRNYRLKTDALAVAANTKHGAYDIFKNRYGIDIYVDYSGAQRSANSPSIGAFEASSSNSPPAQMKPPTFKILGSSD